MPLISAVTGWLRQQLGLLAGLWRILTAPERELAGLLAGVIVAGVPVGLLTDSSSAWSALAVALVVALLAAPVLADAVIVRSETVRQHVELTEAKMVALKVNLAKATGAPRVAEVRCSHGDMQRFIFGPDGWAPAGPAPDIRHEEARTQ